MAQVKKATPPPKKKVKKLIVRNKLPPKKEIVSELQKHTDLTKSEANKLPALELFGMLPTALRKLILTPGDTGTLVGVAPPLSEDEAKTLVSLLDKIHNTDGFRSYLSSWSFYEGPGWGERAHAFWEKKSNQIDSNSFKREMVDLLEEPKMEAIMKSTRKKYGELEGEYGDKLKNFFNAKGELDEDMLYNHDYEEYYPEDRYKNVIDKQLKPEMKQFKAFEKQMKKRIK